MHRVAFRYAKALLQLAVEKKVLDKVHADMLLFDQVWDANKALLHALESPAIKHDKKLAVLQEIFQDKVHVLTMSFVKMVTKKRREDLLPAITKLFLEQHDHHKGIKQATISTTFQLSEELCLQFIKLVQQIAPCNQVVLKQHIDPTLIGGYVLQVDDKRIDQSLRNKLLTLKKTYVTEAY
jgi:F-type H+-transporting ATPase subunit delta